MKRRILLVDDVADNLEFLAVKLRDTYDVFSYRSCQDALLAMRHLQPDLLVLDILMVPMNGVEFLKEFRAMEGFENVPAIAVTAMAHDVEKQTFAGAGFQAILTKPIRDLEKFEALIDRLLTSAQSEVPAKQDMYGSTHYPRRLAS